MSGVRCQVSGVGVAAFQRFSVSACQPVRCWRYFWRKTKLRRWEKTDRLRAFIVHMKNSFPHSRFSLAFLGVIAGAVLTTGCKTNVAAQHRAELGRALTFHASFDTSVDAEFGKGDRRLHVAPKWGHPRMVQPGLPPGNTVHLAPGEGRYGGALRFERKIDELVAYRAARNVSVTPGPWGGTVSFWLRVSPDADLAPGYCDMIQITPRDWNDAAFFTEFTKDEKPREFRLGAYADLKVWNPNNRDWNAIPLAEKPLIPVLHPPFSRDRWTHVAFTWENYNTGQANGATRLYLDGQLRGELSPRIQTFTWDPEKCLIMLGLAYTGWMDDLAIFDRALSPVEITYLNGLKGGVQQLHRVGNP